jgi:hypothetical protein
MSLYVCAPALRQGAIASTDGPVQAGGNPDGLLADDDGRSLEARLRSVRASLAHVRARLTPRRTELLGLVLVAIVLMWLQGGAVLASLKHTLVPYRLNGDAQQQIFPFFRYLEPNAFGSDYITDYYLSSYPLGYWALYAVPARLGIDPTRVSHALPHVLWICTVLGVGAVAHRLGGKLGAFCAMALALGSNVYLGRIQGGLPRGFGFPIMAMALVGLAYARVGWCVLSVLLGALFYPVAGIVSGFSLAALLLLPERTGCSVNGWPWRRRLFCSRWGRPRCSASSCCCRACSAPAASVRRCDRAMCPSIPRQATPDATAPRVAPRFQGFCGVFRGQWITR